jgi:hypothetical protein
MQPLLLDCILQRDRVDHCGQHAHVIGGHAVHRLGLLGNSAKEIAAAHYDRHFNAQFVNFGNFPGYFVDFVDINAKTPACSQCFP